MTLCSVIEGISSTFSKECCSCVEGKFVFAQEWKRWIELGSQALPYKNSKVGIPYIYTLYMGIFCIKYKV